MIDHHFGRGPFGLSLPGWYLAPQQREVARAGWDLLATLTGAREDGPLRGLENEQLAVSLLQLGSEFGDAALCERLWEAADEFLEPSWDRERGEFTCGLQLGEPHPRGQLNARIAAARACTQGAWSRVFNEPNLSKFDEPTIVGVDFPAVALSEASWDSARAELIVTAVPQNLSVRGRTTCFRVTNVDTARGWTLRVPGASSTALASERGDVLVEVPVDGTRRLISRS